MDYHYLQYFRLPVLFLIVESDKRLDSDGIDKFPLCHLSDGIGYRTDREYTESCQTAGVLEDL